MDPAVESIKQFLQKHVNISSFSDKDDIFALGVNSLFTMQLIVWIENTFRIQIDDADLELTNFNSVDAIARFAERKRLKSTPVALS